MIKRLAKCSNDFKYIFIKAINSLDSIVEAYHIVEIVKFKEEYFVIASQRNINQAYIIGDKLKEQYMLNIGNYISWSSRSSRI